MYVYVVYVPSLNMYVCHIHKFVQVDTYVMYWRSVYTNTTNKLDHVCIGHMHVHMWVHYICLSALAM
jgi:hypothetical protein